METVLRDLEVAGRLGLADPAIHELVAGDAWLPPVWEEAGEKLVAAAAPSVSRFV